MPKKEPAEHRFRFAQRWEHKRHQRSPRAMWLTLLLDALLIALIFGIIYIGLRGR